MLDRILDIAGNLAAEPTRGTAPKELRAWGDQEFRQMLFKPYRLIYRVVEKQGVSYVIVDGRTDMQSLLARRLLGG